MAEYYVDETANNNGYHEVHTSDCKHLGKGKYKKASTFVLNEGKVEREVLFDDLSGVKADLILTEKNARWDLL
ncbi:MAG: hypothetical protein WBD24_02650 [Candidatus Omnitrophota bacterium]